MCGRTLTIACEERLRSFEVRLIVRLCQLLLDHALDDTAARNQVDGAYGHEPRNVFRPALSPPEDSGVLHILPYEEVSTLWLNNSSIVRRLEIFEEGFSVFGIEGHFDLQYESDFWSWSKCRL